MGARFSRLLGYSSNQVGGSTECCTLKQVIEDIHDAGLESSNIILGIDFTKSNFWTGKSHPHGQSLHDTSDEPNPYEQAISMIQNTLSDFDEDNKIPCFGFGDVTTHDKEVFSFYPRNRPCNGFGEVLQRYKELLSSIKFSGKRTILSNDIALLAFISSSSFLAGPTSFAPIIDMAITTVADCGNQFHILIIISDGQVAVSEEMIHCSPQAQDTIEAIARASDHPLSIILIGVGDGPWDSIENYVSGQRTFDNFQFINFTDIMSKDIPATEKEEEFAFAALQKIPYQFQASNVIRSPRGPIPRKIPLPPPDTAMSLPGPARFGHGGHTSSANYHS